MDPGEEDRADRIEESSLGRSGREVGSENAVCWRVAQENVILSGVGVREANANAVEGPRGS